MKSVFLSASIPDPRRDPKYYITSDIVAIRDAIRALATVVLPHASLCWGGHPSITPLIRIVAENIGITGANRVRLFQSAFFARDLPSDNAIFESYVLTPDEGTREKSLALMRKRMLSAAPFYAGIFIGGMDGVEHEYLMFREFHPRARVLPIASTGGAAKVIYDNVARELQLPRELRDQYAYPSLFRRLLELPNESIPDAGGASSGPARPEQPSGIQKYEGRTPRLKVLIVSRPNDRLFAEKIEERVVSFLSSVDIVVDVGVDQGSGSEAREVVRKKMIDSDAILIVYGDDRQFVEANLLESSNLPDRKMLPARVVGVIHAPPFDTRDAERRQFAAIPPGRGIDGNISLSEILTRLSRVGR